MNDAGSITLKNGILEYSSESYGSWSLPFDEVAIIAEATNQNGPFADDYFFIFVPKDFSTWFEASFYVSNREEFLKALSSYLEVQIQLELVSSTSSASRILWPAEKVGEPLFEYRSISRFKNRQEFRSDLLP